MKSVLTVLALIWFGLAAGCGGQESRTGEKAPADTSAVESETSEVSSVASDSVAPVLTYAQRKGKRLYDHYCAVCHGTEGKGDGFNAYNLNPRPRDFTQKEYLARVNRKWLTEVVSQGGRGVKLSTAMPSYEKTLSRRQIEDIVAYLTYLADTGQGNP